MSIFWPKSDQVVYVELSIKRKCVIWLLYIFLSFKIRAESQTQLNQWSKHLIKEAIADRVKSELQAVADKKFFEEVCSFSDQVRSELEAERSSMQSKAFPDAEDADELDDDDVPIDQYLQFRGLLV